MQSTWNPSGNPAQWTCRGPAVEEPAEPRGPWKSFAPSPYGERQSLVERDYKFAEAAMTKPTTMGQLLKESGQAAENLQFFTHRKPWVWGYWGVEILWVMYLLVMGSIEFFRYCPFETYGVLPHCGRCFSTTFLTWIGIFVLTWSLNLFVYILLVSRGFRFSPIRPVRCLPDSARNGIPKTPVLFFLGLNGFLILWGITGFIVAIASNRCSDGVMINKTVPRSLVMFWSTLLTSILSPIFFVLGRRAMPPLEDGLRQGSSRDPQYSYTEQD